MKRELSLKFDKIYILTQGGPGTSTTTSSIYIFDSAFKIFDIGKVSAMSWTFAILLIIFILPLILFLMRKIYKL